MGSRGVYIIFLTSLTNGEAGVDLFWNELLLHQPARLKRARLTSSAALRDWGAIVGITAALVTV